ncbi:MAG: hypothetical protein OXT65_05725 [Alphaproteobacteria bacterium]|nr:hypothetical protein [Alphaproteobacteria bacterium]
MTTILEAIGVARRTTESDEGTQDVNTIFGGYLQTADLQRAKVYAHQPTAPAAAPAKAAAPAAGMMGGGSSGGGKKAPAPENAPAAQESGGISPRVNEYEIFINQKNALAFFMNRSPILDENPEEGPFWFVIDKQRIIAGTADAYAVFEEIEERLLDVARRRGVITLVEFQDQQPYRITPCYLVESL